MDFLEIKQKIQEKLNLKHKDIVLTYYQILIDNHSKYNDVCQCNHCIILREYVRLKKLNHHNLKKINYLEYIEEDRKIIDNMLHNYSSISYKIEILKREKNKLKQLS